MAGELGMNPKSLGKPVPSKSQQWKSSLPESLEELYEKRFNRIRPDVVLSIEEALEKKRLKRVEQKAARKNAEPSDESEEPVIAPDPIEKEPEDDGCPF
ncbi:MAG: hypothetical protein ACI8T1_002300 [Verrucomicrobiales bacterium]|jgi:hypothetical protein